VTVNMKDLHRDYRNLKNDIWESKSNTCYRTVCSYSLIPFVSRFLKVLGHLKMLRGGGGGCIVFNFFPFQGIQCLKFMYSFHPNFHRIWIPGN